MDTTLADSLVGRVLDGRYRIDARLAGGGMGTVYTATDTRLDRTVAVKVMQPAYAADPAFISRFISEARAAARLSSPHVVAVFDQGSEPATGSSPPVVFLVMEYVAGRTLRQLLHEQGRLAPAPALRLLEPVLGALGAAHAAGLVHRDVKPENVLLAADGRVKVADFGLARAVEATTATASVTMLIGTVAYLAPEQVSSGASDARTDVYATGILLYELLTGRLPFDGPSPMAIAFRHVHEDVPPVSAAVPGVPRPVEELVRRATDRNPARRFADAHEFLAAVRGVLSRLPATPPRPAAQAPPRPRPAAGTPAAGTPTTVEPLTVAANPTAIVVPELPAAVRPARRRGNRLVVLLVLGMTVLAAVAGWWLALGRYTSTPSVLATTQSAANAALTAAELNPQWLPDRFSATVPKGKVAYAEPGPGERILRDGTVALALSKGPEIYKLPVLAGATLARAQHGLAELRLRSAVRYTYSDAVAAGSVVATRPKAGAMLRPGDLVIVTLSRGRQPITVPDVRSLSAGEAEAALKKLDFTVKRTETFSDSVPAGDVISSTPPAGRTAPHATAVGLVVSKGPQLFPIPDVRRLSAEEAQRTLRAAGFRVRTFEPFGFGLVHVVSPKVGTMVARDTTVSIIVY